MNDKLINAETKQAIFSETYLERWRELIMKIIAFWDVNMASQLRNPRSHLRYKLKISQG
jgi:hypothetical protein